VGGVDPSSVSVNGVELRLRRWGSGPPLLCLHETATTGEVFEPLAIALADRHGRADQVEILAPDRRGWGGSTAPEPYGRTTVPEQAEDAAALLAACDAAPALLCGAGIGAVVALDLHLRHPGMSSGAILIEPPLLAFVPEATEALSGDRAALEEALRERGLGGAVALYLDGELPAMGAGAERIPSHLVAPARERAMSLFAELGAVAGWELPLAAMAVAESPLRVVIGAATPPLVRKACLGLESRLARSELHELGTGGLPHVEGAVELAALVGELLDGEGR
jgi:pimeloyl-ACP methyl ester carboxylesterase